MTQDQAAELITNMFVMFSAMMIINAIMVVIFVIVIQKHKVEYLKSELSKIKKYDALELLVKEHFFEILKILKNN